MLSSWCSSWCVGSIVTGVIGTPLILLAIFPWLRYDFLYIALMNGLMLRLKSYVRKKMTLPDLFEDRVRQNPQKTFLVFGDEIYTYEAFNRKCNRVAHAARSIGLAKGSVVAMFMYNEPACVWTFIGLSKLGIVVTMLNNNLRSKSLLHCLSVSGASHIIAGHQEELRAAIEEIYPSLDSVDMARLAVFVHGCTDVSLPNKFRDFQVIFDDALEDNPDVAIRNEGKSMNDTLVNIYTSGTTGLPKAARISHQKFYKGALLMYVSGVKKDDVIYMTLPLYHTSGAIIGLGNTIERGATMVLRAKFSASNFWDDCRKHNVTVFQYIGELCRYLVAQPKTVADRHHSVRIAIGNGLRRDIWREFKERFGIAKIREFYAATEGNMGFINLFNKEGAIGRTSPFLQKLVPSRLIKYDQEANTAARGEDGFCTPVRTEEPGLLVIGITRDFQYDGYVGNRAMTEKKILRDVFKTGDRYFNSGDLLVTDRDYFLYFHDRIGDTFRWKGENVSTVEVANVVSDLDWIEDANVYGVCIPGHDGRAGMAAITTSAPSDGATEMQLRALYRHCEELLPAYARPRFVRVQREMTMTGTLKQMKTTLVEDGFDPQRCGGDVLYYASGSSKMFALLDATAYDDVNSGHLRM